MALQRRRKRKRRKRERRISVAKKKTHAKGGGGMALKASAENQRESDVVHRQFNIYYVLLLTMFPRRKKILCSYSVIVDMILYIRVSWRKSENWRIAAK